MVERDPQRKKTMKTMSFSEERQLATSVKEETRTAGFQLTEAAAQQNAFPASGPTVQRCGERGRVVGDSGLSANQQLSEPTVMVLRKGMQ